MSSSHNPFESGDRKVIPAVLVYIKKGDRILMIHRNAKTPGRVDYHEGKWNGLGGKCDLDESPLEAALREVHEESGLSLHESELKALGVIQFPHFKVQKNEDWMVFLFTAELDPCDSRQVNEAGEEGELHWIPTQDLLSLNLWPGDRLFIPAVMSGKPIVGTIWYKDGQVARHWIQFLSCSW